MTLKIEIKLLVKYSCLNMKIFVICKVKNLIEISSKRTILEHQTVRVRKKLEFQLV